MKEKRKELFRNASVIALDNSSELFEDAAILYELMRYPRAFSLGILSCEEMAKSFIYKCVSLEILKENEIHKPVKIHEEKILKSSHLMTLAILFSDHSDEIARAIDHDKNKTNHDEHIFPQILNNLGMHSAGVVVKSIFKAHDLKLDSLYVHIRENKIVNPKDVVNKKKCDELFTLIGKSISMMNYLNDKDDIFRLYTERFLSGTIEEMKTAAKGKKK